VRPAAAGLAAGVLALPLLLAAPASGAGGAGDGAPEVLPVAAASRQPSVAVDARDGVHVAFVGEGGLMVASLASGSRSFEAHRVAEAKDIAVGMRRGPRIAACGDTLVVTWIEARFDPVKRKQSGCRDLLASRSLDGGATWSPPRPVNRRREACAEGLHALAAGPGRAFYAAWLQPGEERKQGALIRLARSEDDGATWAGETTACAVPGGTVCPCCHPSVAVAPDGTVAVLFRNAVEGARDMYVVTSSDRGRTFGPARKVGTGTWKLDSCPMDGGGLAFGFAGALLTAWRREQTVFAAPAATRPGPARAETDLGPGSQPWVGGVPGSTTVAVWTRADGDLGIRELNGADLPFLRVAAGGGRCEFPQVSSSASGVVFAAWERENKDGIRRVEGAFLLGGPAPR
jgi:hypothetical protein